MGKSGDFICFCSPLVGPLEYALRHVKIVSGKTGQVYMLGASNIDIDDFKTYPCVGRSVVRNRFQIDNVSDTYL